MFEKLTFKIKEPPAMPFSEFAISGSQCYNDHRYMTMVIKMLQIGAGEFKAKCLKLMDLTEKKHETIIITKRGIPVAKLVPYSTSEVSPFGFMKNTLTIKEDIIAPIQEKWDAETS
jgi:prevent-host-death family protein